MVHCARHFKATNAGIDDELKTDKIFEIAGVVDIRGLVA